MAHLRPSPVGGKFLSPFTLALMAVAAVGVAVIVARFVLGLGATSAMSDGYPWGIWIVIDMVIGTGIGSGGFAMALVVYIANRGHYHPLVRPAMLTSALGYTVGAVGIVLDLGRWWNLWKVPIAWDAHFNWNSGLLEVALCVMVYTIVLWVEVAPAFLEYFRDHGPDIVRRASRALLPRLDAILFAVLALGVVLPAMHQSTLGSLFLVAETKLHPLWYTPILPLLFLVTCLALGYAAVVVETILYGRALGQMADVFLLAGLKRLMAGVALAFVAVRLADVALRGRFGLALNHDGYALLFWAENALFLLAAAWLAGRARDTGALLREGGALLLAGFLYRLDVYITAFDPGNGWRYFPSVAEIWVTLTVTSLEILAALFLVRKFPILAGVPAPEVGGRP
ncbi:MAG TPA: Ni/Fe-hydrogenase cytochrome b subunit [Anaeromyxobacteraceae bacterium]|jgi:Ni/Fe-hydrogenase subunit HybB-like protein